MNPYWNPYFQFLAKVSKGGACEASENWFSVVRFGTLPLGLLVRHRRRGERQIRRWRQRRGQCRGSPVAQQCPPCVEKCSFWLGSPLFTSKSAVRMDLHPTSSGVGSDSDPHVWWLPTYQVQNLEMHHPHCGFPTSILGVNPPLPNSCSNCNPPLNPILYPIIYNYIPLNIYILYALNIPINYPNYNTTH